MQIVRYDPIHPDVPPVPGPDETGYTPNYKLLLVLRNTVTSWLTILNTNMALIDTAMHNLELRTSIDGQVPPEAINDIIKLNEQVAELQETVKQIAINTANITNLQTQVTTNTTDIATLKVNYTNLDTRIVTLAASLQNVQETLEKVQTNLLTLTGSVTDLETRVTALENKNP